MSTYVIDIDGTICTQALGDYSHSKPFYNRIRYINYLFQKGNEIIYFTARGMATSYGDPVKAADKWEQFTIKQLNSWGARYHKLIFGKPSADFYIDDKSIDVTKFFKDL